MTTDYAHTRTADVSRKAKARALAGAARSLGMQPYELRVIGGTEQHLANRTRVRRLAQVRDASVETWQMAVGMLEAMGRSVSRSGPCPACGYPTLTVETAEGRRPLLLDPFPHPLGTVWQDESGVARVLAGHEERPDDVSLYRQHAASCPESPAVARRTAPRCEVCHQPLNAALAAEDPTYTSHPTCDPREEVQPP